MHKCADHKVEALCEALQATVQQWRGRFPSPLPLELYTSSNFIGLFVGAGADVLKQFAADFATDAARKAGRNEEPPTHNALGFGSSSGVQSSVQSLSLHRVHRFHVGLVSPSVRVTAQ
ncbi:hypothetical protein INR49_016266 [Caranx melampygus]|nr:hypothetical protein INR49_016266 [Caranx melampygus]